MAALLLVVGVALGGGGTTAVEGGAYFDFVAPDPLGPTDGTIRFGFSGAVETIAADAVLVPPADTNLAFLGGGSPTCLAVTREGGVITQIAFVEDCTISGTVTRVDDLFGPGGDAYLIADRVAAPADLVEGTPPFGALIGTAAAAGTTLEIVFTLDMATGVPESFVGQSAVTGPVTILAGGDIGVGAATLPNAVIDDTSRAQLEDAAALGVDATVTVDGQGTIGQKGEPNLVVSLTVTYTAPTPVPTPVPTAVPTQDQLPDTSAPPAVEAPWAGPVVLWLAGLTAMVGIRTLGARRRRVE
jgi:hypothetical protein